MLSLWSSVFFVIAKRATSEHLTPKDVVITSGPAQTNLVMFLKGQQHSICNITINITLFMIRMS